MRPVVPWSPIRSVPTSNERNHPRALRKRLVSELSVLLSVEASTLVAVCRLTRRRRRTDLSIACAASLACIRYPLLVAYCRSMPLWPTVEVIAFPSDSIPPMIQNIGRSGGPLAWSGCGGGRAKGKAKEDKTDVYEFPSVRGHTLGT
jgi:hypothetical protein